MTHPYPSPVPEPAVHADPRAAVAWVLLGFGIAASVLSMALLASSIWEAASRPVHGYATLFTLALGALVGVPAVGFALPALIMIATSRVRLRRSTRAILLGSLLVIALSFVIPVLTFAVISHIRPA